MIYSSVVFIFVFLPLLLVLYYLVPRLWAKNLILFLFSAVFYFWGAGKFLILLLSVGFLAWLFGLLITKTRFKSFFLTFAIITFVLILIFNKYVGFIIDNLIYLGVSSLPDIKVLTTLGVSFYTLQAISYNVDLYRKSKYFEPNPAYVILYIAMFPQLISGPFVQYKEIGVQLKSRSFNLSLFSEGVRRFITGLGKKVLIADQLSPLVSRMVDDNLIILSPETAWVAMLVFAIQIYFDFSGYTDMAIGAGKMLGFHLPENFNYPYISKSATEFWRRWHMSFGRWLRDYIFNPLAFNLRYWDKTGIFIAIFITFIFVGIWHGPTWNFVIWGTIFGILLGLEELFLLKFLKRIKGFAHLYIIFVFLISAVFFRTPDLQSAARFFSFMFTLPQGEALHLNSFFTLQHLIILACGILLSIPLRPSIKLIPERASGFFKAFKFSLLFIVFIFSLMRIITETYNPFIYFQF